jgi:MFS family permease
MLQEEEVRDGESIPLVREIEVPSMSRTRPLHLAVHETSASTSEGVWSPHYRRLTLGLILLTIGPGIEALAAATILPKIVADLGGLSLYGWSFSAFLLATIFGLILAGDAADRRGPALPFMLGVALFVLGLILAGTASSMLMFVLSRGVQGLGAGILDSVAYVCLGRGYPEQVKPRMIAVFASCFVVPGLIGPAFAGIVVALAGWRWVFLGLVPLVPLAAVLLLSAVKELTPATISGSWDPRRLFAAVGLVIGAGMTLSGLQVPSVPLALALTLPGLLVGTLSLHRLLPPGTLKAQAGMPAAIAIMGLLNLAYYGAEAFLPLTLVAIRGQSPLIAGFTLTAATLTWAAGSWVQAQLAPGPGPGQESRHWWQRWGSWVQARLAPRQSRRLLVTAGLLLIALGLAGIACVLMPGMPVVVAAVAWGVGGLGMGLAYSTISLVVLETAPPGQEGSATASMELASVLGSALGTGLGGVIIGVTSAAGSVAGTGIAVVDLFVLAVTGLAILTAVRLPGRPQPTASLT